MLSYSQACVQVVQLSRVREGQRHATAYLSIILWIHGICCMNVMAPPPYIDSTIEAHRASVVAIKSPFPPCSGGEADGEGHGGGPLCSQVPRRDVHLHLRCPRRDKRAGNACCFGRLHRSIRGGCPFKCALAGCMGSPPLLWGCPITCGFIRCSRILALLRIRHRRVCFVCLSFKCAIRVVCSHQPDLSWAQML